MMAVRLPGDRLHLQHGPIDLVIGADGDRAAAFRAAEARFDGMLQQLAAELPRLRAPSGDDPSGPVARRMVRAVAPHRGFVTPMAAVAGAVADEIAAAIATCDVGRAYVNNGGDIALILRGNARFDVGISGGGMIVVGAEDNLRGVATSGQGGRSFSRGIADSVTVLAQTAAAADVAATLIANAVDVPGSKAVRRVPANELDPQSDLGTRLVVTSVGHLPAKDIAVALERGKAVARRMQRDGLIETAALALRGQMEIVERMVDA